MAREMGKPLAAGRAEAEKCAWVCRYYADHAAEHLADIPLEADRARSYIHHEPLGVVLAVMPWNFPLWQVFRFAAPALMAGNGGLLKHASNVTGCSLAIERLFAEGGAPDGPVPQPEDRLEGGRGGARARPGPGRHPHRQRPGGSAVAATAGRLLKKTVLELGGSRPLRDPRRRRHRRRGEDVRHQPPHQLGPELHRRQAVRGGRRGARRLRRGVRGRDGSGRGRRPDGRAPPPSARWPRSRCATSSTTRSSVRSPQGAELRLGGRVPTGPGAYYPPTVLAGITPDMVAGDEELFGPVAAVMRAADEADAIRMANETVFGLGAAVFTADLGRGERIAAERARGRVLLRQRLRRLRPTAALRRHQGLGLRARAEPPRHPRVREPEDGRGGPEADLTRPDLTWPDRPRFRTRRRPASDRARPAARVRRGR